MGRPNPEGWKGGSEDFTYLSNQRGHIVDSPGLHYPDNDDDHDAGIDAANARRYTDYGYGEDA